MQYLKAFSWGVGSTGVFILSVAWPIDRFGLNSPIVAVWVNWLAMTWFVILSQFIRLSLPPGFYEIQAFEQTGRIYELLGIRWFRRLVRRGPLALLNTTIRLPQKITTSSLRLLERETRQAETGHWVVFLVVAALAIVAVLGGWFAGVAWLTLFNLIFNVYPVMLQRYNRSRINRLLGRRSTFRHGR